MRKLKPFGHGSLSFTSGYDLPTLVGHLANLVGQEQIGGVRIPGVRATRLVFATDAIQKLREVMALGGEK
jgi:hypothetical protein